MKRSLGIAAIAALGILVPRTPAEGSIVRAWETTLRDAGAARRDFSTLKSKLLLDGSLLVVGNEAAGLTATRYDSGGSTAGIVVLPLSAARSVEVDAFGVVAAVGTFEGRAAVFLVDGIRGVSLWPRPFAFAPRPGSGDVLLRPRFMANGDVVAVAAYGPAYDWDLAVLRLDRSDGSPHWSAPAVLSVGSLVAGGLDHVQVGRAGDVAVSAWAGSVLSVQVFDGGTGSPKWPAPAEYNPSSGGTGRVVDDPGFDTAGNVFVTSRVGPGILSSGRWSTISFDGVAGAERWHAERNDRGSGARLGPRFQSVDGEGRVVVAGQDGDGLAAFVLSASGARGPEFLWTPPSPFSPDRFDLIGFASLPGDELLLLGGENSMRAARVQLASGRIAWQRALPLTYLGDQHDSLPSVSAARDGTFVVTADYGTTVRIDSATGADAWAPPRTIDGLLAAPAAVSLLASRPNGDAIAVSGFDAATLWRLEATTGAPGSGWPVIWPNVSPRRMVVDVNGDVAVLAVSSALDAVLQKFDGSTGLPKWIAPRVLGDVSWASDPLLLAADQAGDFVVAGQGALGALRVVRIRGADGSTIWSTAFAPGGTGTLHARALVPDAQGNVVVAAVDPFSSLRAFVIRLQGSDGAGLWPAPLAIDGFFLGLAADGSGSVYAAAATSPPGGSTAVNRLWKLDSATGAPLWTRDFSVSLLEDSLAAGASGDLFLASRQVRITGPASPQDYAITRLSASEGSPLWAQPAILPGEFAVLMSAQIMVRPGGNAVVHVHGTPPTTWELDAASGSPVWGPLPGEEYDASSNVVLTPDGVTVQFWRTLAHDTTSIAIDAGIGLPPAACGAPYSFPLAARNAVPPISWDLLAGALPQGIVLDAATGLLSGSSAEAGSHPFRLRARDGVGAVAERDASLDVVCDGRVAIAGSAAISCGSGTTLSIPGNWSSYRWLPGGETTPTLAVDPRVRASYGVEATDANGCTYRGSADVDVTSPLSPLVLAPSSATAGEKGLAASVSAHAGSQYAWAIQNGVVTSGQGANAIGFTAGKPGALFLAATETDAAACSSAPGYAAVPVTPAPSNFQLLVPCRVLDTRLLANGPRLQAGETRLIAAPGPCGVPITARAVVLNVTAVQPDAAGALVVVPGDAATVDVNTVSFRSGETRASMSVVPVATDGSGTIAIRNDSPGGVDVVLDVTGWFE